MAGALLMPVHAAVVARYHRLIAGAEGPVEPVPEGTTAGEARGCLGEGRVAEALDFLVGAIQALAGAVCAGPPAAAVRDSLRGLLPLLGCVAPATSARAWAILGLRGRPSERFADGSLVDEPAPPWPSQRLFPDALIGGDPRTS